LTDAPYLSVNSSALCQSHERLSQKVHPSPPLGDAPVSIDPPETRGLCISQQINTSSNFFNPLYSPTISFVSQQTPCRNSVRITRNERTKCRRDTKIRDANFAVSRKRWQWLQNSCNTRIVHVKPA